MAKKQSKTVERIRAAIGTRSIVLVGMMGAGKTSIGKRMATALGLSFVDADHEIEHAAGMTIAEIFAAHGEAYFRSGEVRVITRLLDNGPQVLATGGGAYMNEATRARIAAQGISVWLKAAPEVLMRRVRRRHDRPLLRTPDPEATLRRMVDERYPVYAQADIVANSREVAHDVIVAETIEAIAVYLGAKSVAPEPAAHPVAPTLDQP